jgi:hypothetical protein
VTRFAALRRLIALTVLLCQVVTAAHFPVVQAQSASDGKAVLGHCAERSAQTRDVDRPATRSTGLLHHSGHPDSCGCGLGQCACAQAPALSPPPFSSAAAIHLPVMVAYRLPKVLQPVSAFFRPPI